MLWELLAAVQPEYDTWGPFLTKNGISNLHSAVFSKVILASPGAGRVAQFASFWLHLYN